MATPRPQIWTRTYAEGLELRIATHRGGIWELSGNGLMPASSAPGVAAETMKRHADARALRSPTRAWERRCPRCDAVMHLEHRARAASTGATTIQPNLWACPGCSYAEDD